MSQKRQQEDGKGRSDANSPDDKRRRVPALRNVVQEVMKRQSVQHLLEPVLEPLIRRVLHSACQAAVMMEGCHSLLPSPLVTPSWLDKTWHRIRQL